MRLAKAILNPSRAGFFVWLAVAIATLAVFCAAVIWHQQDSLLSRAVIGLNAALLAMGFVAVREVYRDVSEDRQALQQEIEQYGRIFKTSLDLILVTDRRGWFIRVSPSSEAILGYRPDEMIGHVGVDFIHPDDLERTREEMRAARHGLAGHIRIET